MRMLCIALLLAVTAAAAHAEDVYRTLQPDGTVVYSDRPLSAASVKVDLNVKPADPDQAAALASELAAREDARRQAAGGSNAFEAARAEQQKLRATACEEARSALSRYERAPRLYEELPDGGRRLLSDEETARIRVDARQAVADFCDPADGPD